MNNKKTKPAMVALFATLATTGTILAASIPRGIPVGEAVHARSGEADEEGGEREEEERHPGVAAPRARAVDHHREHVEVRVAHRVAIGPTLQVAVAEDDQRQEQQTEQQQRRRETQLASLNWAPARRSRGSGPRSAWRQAG